MKVILQSCLMRSSLSKILWQTFEYLACSWMNTSPELHRSKTHYKMAKRARFVLINLWLLSELGDEMYTADNSSQIDRILSISDGKPLDSQKVLKSRPDAPDGFSHAIFSPFSILCYSYAFDIKSYAPSQRTLLIHNFEGERLISSLPVCLLKLREDSESFRAYLINRGRSFVALVGDGQKFVSFHIHV